MKRIIAIANHKGGVGKTTSVASIGAALATRGNRVLLVDLDAQANLTASLTTTPTERTIYDSLKEEQRLPIMNVGNNLDLVCSSLDMINIELELSGRTNKEYRLKDLLNMEYQKYDYILLDCPPSLGLVTLNALVAADSLYITLTAEALPSKGLSMLTDVLQIVKSRLYGRVELDGVIITRWENSKLSKLVEEKLRSTFGSSVFNTKIRKNVAIAEAPLFAQDIITYSPDSNGARDYTALADEIEERIEQQQK